MIRWSKRAVLVIEWLFLVRSCISPPRASFPVLTPGYLDVWNNWSNVIRLHVLAATVLWGVVAYYACVSFLESNPSCFVSQISSCEKEVPFHIAVFFLVQLKPRIFFSLVASNVWCSDGSKCLTDAVVDRRRCVRNACTQRVVRRNRDVFAYDERPILRNVRGRSTERGGKRLRQRRRVKLAAEEGKVGPDASISQKSLHRSFSERSCGKFCYLFLLRLA